MNNKTQVKPVTQNVPKVGNEASMKNNIVVVDGIRYFKRKNGNLVPQPTYEDVETIGVIPNEDMKMEYNIVRVRVTSPDGKETHEILSLRHDSPYKNGDGEMKKYSVSKIAFPMNKKLLGQLATYIQQLSREA